MPGACLLTDASESDAPLIQIQAPACEIQPQDVACAFGEAHCANTSIKGLQRMADDQRTAPAELQGLVEETKQ